MSRNRRTNAPLPLSCSPGFPGWLQQAGISLAVSTHQTNRLFLIGVNADGGLCVRERLFDGAMGLFARADTLWLATRYQVWRLEQAPVCHDRYRDHDRVYLPRAAQVTGHLDTHDLVVEAGGRIVFANTLYSCLAAPDERLNFRPVWVPPFISTLAPEDRCHLNGIALHDGRAAYVSCIAQTDVAGGWRAQRRDGGCIVDVHSDDIVAQGLCMPHSPRVHGGRLWVLQSGTGEVGVIDRRDGRFEPVAFCPGYLRGLVVRDGYLIATTSRAREGVSHDGLPLAERLNGSGGRCGIWVIDPASGAHLHHLWFEAPVQELYDVQVLDGVRRPALVGLRNDEVERIVAFEHEGRTVVHEVVTAPAGPTATAVPLRPVAAAPAPEVQYVGLDTLGAEQVLARFAALSFPDLRKIAAARRLREPLLAVIAFRGEHPIGMIVGERLAEAGEVRILSFFVQGPHRRQGIGRALLKHFQALAGARGAVSLQIQYRANWRSRAAIERLLEGEGWGAPRPWMLLCDGTMEGIRAAPWVHRLRVPRGCEVFPWSELREDERRALEADARDAPWFPPELTPFQEEDRIEPLNSLGLRKDGRLVGWLITHRVAADTIQYTALCVHPQLQGRGHAIALLAEAIRRQMASDVPRGTCQIHLINDRMLRVFRRHIAPYYARMVELYRAERVLNAAPARGGRAQEGAG